MYKKKISIFFFKHCKKRLMFIQFFSIVYGEETPLTEYLFLLHSQVKHNTVQITCEKTRVYTRYDVKRKFTNHHVLVLQLGCKVMDYCNWWNAKNRRGVDQKFYASREGLMQVYCDVVQTSKTKANIKLCGFIATLIQRHTSAKRQGFF